MADQKSLSALITKAEERFRDEFWMKIFQCNRNQVVAKMVCIKAWQNSLASMVLLTRNGSLHFTAKHQGPDNDQLFIMLTFELGEEGETKYMFLDASTQEVICTENSSVVIKPLNTSSDLDKQKCYFEISGNIDNCCLHPYNHPHSSLNYDSTGRLTVSNNAASRRYNISSIRCIEIDC